MKFETKLERYEIDENEVKSIIENCECGEVNGAYFIDLTKEKKEFIMEVIGNYIDDDSGEFDGWTDIKRIATFCKLFDISEEEIPSYYVEGFNEDGCDIAYELESNKNVLLVLTDDERYFNSFIKYSPSQRAEEEDVDSSSSPAEESKPKVLIKTIENQEYNNNGDYTENIEQHLKTEGFEIDKSTIVYEDTPFITCTEDTIEFIESAEITYVDDNRFYAIKQDQVGDYMVYTGKRDNTQKLEDYLSNNLLGSKNFESELESLISQFDDETDLDTICLDKELMAEYESKKAEIENEISEIEEEIEKVNEQMEEIEMRKERRFMTEREAKGDDYTFCYDCNHLYGDDECNNCDYYVEEDVESSSSEKYVSFKLESKSNSNVYLAGCVDINTIDDTDGGNWEYEQNDGTFDSHIPNYWKTFDKDLTDEFHDFLNTIDWEAFQQALCDFKDENRTFDCGEYFLHINEGAKMECEIVEREDIADFFVEVIPVFNGEKVDIVTFINDTNEVFDVWDNAEDNHSFCKNGHIYFEMSKDYWDDSFKEELIEDVNEEARRIYARCLTYELGVYAKYGEQIEQSLDDSYDNEWLFKLSQLNDDNLESFLQNEVFIYDEE